MSEGASGAEQCVLDAFREQMCMQNFAFEPTDGSSHILQALILQDVETIKESDDIGFVMACSSDFATATIPTNLSKEQTVKLLQFSQLTVQCMKHIKSKALQKQAEAEKQADLYHRECQRLQEELKKRMIENCRLIAGGPMGGSSAAPADPDAASQQVQQDECPDDEPTGAPPHTEDDRMMLADLVSELKRNKLVDGKQAGQLDKEMASLKIGEQNTLWDVLARYEDSGDIRLVLKDLNTHVFAASGGEAA